MYLKVKDQNEIIRDSDSQAILCVDKSILKKHERYEYEKRKEQTHKNEINTLQCQISELREMIKSLVTRDN